MEYTDPADVRTLQKHARDFGDRLSTIPASYDTLEQEDSDSITTEDIARSDEDESQRSLNASYAEDDGNVQFGYSSNSKLSAKQDSTSNAAAPSPGSFKMTVQSVGEDENDVEVIPRDMSLVEGTSVSRARSAISSLRVGNGKETETMEFPTDTDLTLFIKMSLHPLTLFKYLSRDAPQKGSGKRGFT